MKNHSLYDYQPNNIHILIPHNEWGLGNNGFGFVYIGSLDMQCLFATSANLIKTKAPINQKKSSH